MKLKLKDIKEMKPGDVYTGALGDSVPRDMHELECVGVNEFTVYSWGQGWRDQAPSECDAEKAFSWVGGMELI